MKCRPDAYIKNFKIKLTIYRPYVKKKMKVTYYEHTDHSQKQKRNH